jgi:hypothetical protein
LAIVILRGLNDNECHNHLIRSNFVAGAKNHLLDGKPRSIFHHLDAQHSFRERHPMKKRHFGATLALLWYPLVISGCGDKPADKAVAPPMSPPAHSAPSAQAVTPAQGTPNETAQASNATALIPAKTGPVLPAAKIDIELQKKVASIGEQLKADIAKQDAEKPPAATPGEGAKPAAKVNPPVTPLLTSDRQDLSYIPTDAFSGMVIHPRRACANSVVKALRAMLPPDAMNGMTSRGGSPLGAGFGPNVGPKDLIEMAATCGISAENTDEVVFLFDKKLLEVAAAGGAGPTPEIPPFGFILRNSAPIDTESLLGLLKKAGSPVEISTHDGVTLIVVPKHSAAVAFVTDSMILVGHTDFVKKMISGLTRRLEGVGNRIYVLAIDGMAVEAPLAKMAGQLPGMGALFAPYITGTKGASIAFDLDAPQLLDVGLQFKRPAMASGLFTMLDQQFAAAKQNAPQLRAMGEAEPESAPLLPYFDQLVSGSKLALNSDTISFTVPKLKDLEKLPDLLKPVVEKAAQAAKDTEAKNNLKQIGVAFHNYHNTFNVFPALNGDGMKGQPHPGLSWRVYLLPYQEFKLDEPWDSEHNKKLISKMPQIFGTAADGKTSIHVITGKGAPFQNDAGIRLSEIPDGTSNTALAIEAGPDVAEVWTKPGGLTFDPAAPLKCFGEIKEYQVLLFDGSVRRFKNLDPETFSKLVQNADGKPVVLP